MIMCVYHLIHVTTPYQYLPKLVIVDVPEGESPDKGLIDRAGYYFGEFNIRWGNHLLCVVDVKESPSDLVSRIRAGEGERISYAELKQLAEAPL